MKEIDRFASNQTILASSTSCFLPSLFTESLKHRSQALVAHPINPPYFVPLVEIVPASWTSPQTIEKAKEIMQTIGQRPIVLRKEIQGFIVNRIQYAILDECYRLIADNIISVDDIDAVMSEGLGMRYAFLGPWETAHLNANGISEYFEKYAKGIYEVSKTFGETPRMGGPVAEHISKEMFKRIPMKALSAKRVWRDECLIAVSQLKSSKKEK
jgi:AGAP007378-PB